jgi:excisionase family DNA binding protein|tara:strand:- start:1103 stop:1390 length:288 start_codon:yes stop_codon:yes gene_type:complete
MSEIILVSKEDLTSTISSLIKEELKDLNPVKQKEEKEYITRKEVAKLLGISLPTLNDWSKKGVIPSYRIQSRVRYIKAEVLECLKKVNTIKYRSL